MTLHFAGRTGKKGKRSNPVTEEETTNEPSDSVPSTTTKSLELVEWRDANFSREADDEWDGDYICATVGWTMEDDTWLIIVSEVTPGGERAITRVPLVNVTARKQLVIVHSPSTWTTSHEHTESSSSTLPKSVGRQAIRDWS